MSCTSGPKIIKDSSLVLNLDAANPKSYSGTGTSWIDLSRRTGTSTMSNVIYSSSNNGIFSYNGTSSTTSNSSVISGATQFTIMVWFKTNVVANYNNILDFNYQFYGNSNVGPRLEMAADTSLAWVFSGNTGNGGVYTGYRVFNTGLLANVWYNVAITRTSTPIVSTYLNGIYRLDSRVDAGNNADAFVGSFNKITTGVGWASRFHNGFISNILAYNRALSAVEVYNNYIATKGRFGL